MNDTELGPADRRPQGPGLLLAGTLLLLSITALAVLRSLPPAGLPADVRAELFSEARARAVLERLLGDERPHPVGSPEGVALRGRLLSELRALGLQPEERPGFACGNRWGACAPIVNVLARVPGRHDAKAVLLTSHHDSVGAGPGASDAAASVAAILEIARVLLAGELPDRPVLLLFTDGEEAGLLGARSFVEGPEASAIFAVVNGEARGTHGPSALFETGPGNAAFVRAWAKEASRPVTSSTLYDLYKLLASDTDLSVYKERGLPGLNFAFADGHSRYHTPLDDLAHLDPRTLQHHGDNLLAAVRALVSLPGDAVDEGDAVWLDALSFGVVSWRLDSNLKLAGLALGLWLAAASVLLKRRLLRWSEGLIALLGTLFALLLPLPASLGVVWALQTLRSEPSPWTAHPAWATTAVAATCAAVAYFVAASLARRVGSWASWLASGLVALLITAALLSEMPGASSLGLVPALALCASLLIASLWPRRLAAPLLLLGVGVAAWPFLSIAHALHVMMGLEPVLALSVPVAFVASLLGAAAPGGRGRLHAPLAALLIGAVAFTVAGLVPSHSRERPRNVNLLHLESADTRQAFWLSSSSVSEELRAALSPEKQRIEDWPWPNAASEIDATTAEPSGSPGPSLQVLSRASTASGRRLTLRLSSSRDAQVLTLFLPPEARLIAASVEGIPREVTPGRGFRLALRGIPPEGIEVTLELATEAPAHATLEDQLPGLPPGGERLLQARPPSSVPVQDGDRSILYRRIALP